MRTTAYRLLQGPWGIAIDLTAEATSLLVVSFAARAARGRSRSDLRLRPASAIMVVAVAVVGVCPASFRRG